MNQYIGKMLDNRYEILDVIGVGGMAVVYKAYCHRLHRFVAIKVLKKDLASDAEFRRRFHEEAQAVAMLSHPNIVSVYDVSKGDDLDYIVMELIDGITLKQYMQKKDGQPELAGVPATSSPRSSGPWATPTAGGSSTGTSSPKTSWSCGTAASR